MQTVRNFKPKQKRYKQKISALIAKEKIRIHIKIPLVPTTGKFHFSGNYKNPRFDWSLNENWKNLWSVFHLARTSIVQILD